MGSRPVVLLLGNHHCVCGSDGLVAILRVASTLGALRALPALADLRVWIWVGGVAYCTSDRCDDILAALPRLLNVIILRGGRGRKIALRVYETIAIYRK